jgi:hypothetical protein
LPLLLQLQLQLLLQLLLQLQLPLLLQLQLLLLLPLLLQLQLPVLSQNPEKDRVPHPWRSFTATWVGMYTSAPPALAFACSLQPTQKTVISTEATDSLTVRRAAEKPASPPKLSQPVLAVAVLQSLPGTPRLQPWASKNPPRKRHTALPKAGVKA